MPVSDPEKEQLEIMEPEDFGNEAGSQAMDAALRSSFVILKVVIAVLVVYLIFSNTFTVEDKKEGAIILSFGKSRTSAEDVWKPGVRFAWPYPIEERVVIDAVSPVTRDFAWTQYPDDEESNSEDDPEQRAGINASDPRNGYLLTKDNKAINLKAEMSYEIIDFNRFVFGFHDPEAILKTILESAMTHAAKERTLGEILINSSIPKEAIDRDTFEKKVENRVRKLIKQYDLGVQLKGSVTIKMESVPYRPRKSREDYVEQAKDSNDILKDAKIWAKARQVNKGELDKIAKEVKEERQDLVDSLKATAERFNSILKEFPKPAERRRRMEELYNQTMTRIAQNKDVKIYLVPKGDERQPTRIGLKINQPPPKRNKNDY